jgi:hypothetical protein
MAALRPRNRPLRHVAWLLWLVLLLPATQAVSTWHVLSHTAEAGQATDAPDKTAPQTGHCDLCLMAAAVHGGALPGTPSIFSPRSAPHEAPHRVLSGVWQASPARNYQGRAPPDALR